MKILVVEDEIKIQSFIKKGLTAEGFVVDCLDNGDDALLQIQHNPYDAVVLDIMIKGKDGLKVLKKIRQTGDQTPVILVTARGDLEDRLEGLNLGADDYIPKPFHVDELIARLRAVIRRSEGQPTNILQVADLKINLMTREVLRGEEAIELTPREFALLELLARSPERVYSRMQILEYVWSYDFDPNTNLVDVYIKRVREKVDILEPHLIQTVRGVGYKMRQP